MAADGVAGNEDEDTPEDEGERDHGDEGEGGDVEDAEQPSEDDQEEGEGEREGDMDVDDEDEENEAGDDEDVEGLHASRLRRWISMGTPRIVRRTTSEGSAEGPGRGGAARDQVSPRGVSVAPELTSRSSAAARETVRAQLETLSATFEL